MCVCAASTVAMSEYMRERETEGKRERVCVRVCVGEVG